MLNKEPKPLSLEVGPSSPTRRPLKPLHSEASFDERRDSRAAVQSLIRELKEDGIWDDLLEYIRATSEDEVFSRQKIVEEFVVEIAGDNPRLALDAFVYATGLNVYGSLTLREHATRVGYSPEGFSKRVDEIIRRFRLGGADTNRIAA